MAYSIPTEIRIDLVECCVCGIVFGLSETFNLNLRTEKNLWYCPNGHSQSYTARPIREELAESKQKNFMLEQARDRTQDAAARKDKQITSLRKRLKSQAEVKKEKP